MLGTIRKSIELLSRAKGWDPQEHLGGFHPAHTPDNPSGLGRTLPEEPEHVLNPELQIPELPDPGIPSLTRRSNPTPGE